jgi:hypothetical protein
MILVIARGGEDFEFISRVYNPRCAIDAFIIATQIDFGISEDNEGKILFDKKPAFGLLLTEEPSFFTGQGGGFRRSCRKANPTTMEYAPAWLRVIAVQLC